MHLTDDLRFCIPQRIVPQQMLFEISSLYQPGQASTLSRFGRFVDVWHWRVHRLYSLNHKGLARTCGTDHNPGLVRNYLFAGAAAGTPRTRCERIDTTWRA